MERSSWLQIFALTFLIFILSCSKTGREGAIRESTRLIDSLMENTGAVGVAVAVGIDGKLVWSEGFGYANLEMGVPVDPATTRFRVGSVSKPFTATALGQLHEEGKLDWDTHVQKYVPDFPKKRMPVVTRLVAGHLNGIRSYRPGEFIMNYHYETVSSALEIFKNDTLMHPPGSKYLYSSYGFNLLSAVVEGASGEEFLTYMDKHVFQPLKMNHTIADHVDSIIVGRSGYYHYTSAGEVVNEIAVDNSYKWAGGGFLSTAEDLIRFGFGYLDAKILKPETIEILQTTQQTWEGEQTGYGMGWVLETDSAGRYRTGHGGGSVGGTTKFWVYPEERLVIAMISNLSNMRVGEVPTQIVSAFLAMDEND